MYKRIHMFRDDAMLLRPGEGLLMGNNKARGQKAAAGNIWGCGRVSVCPQISHNVIFGTLRWVVRMLSAVSSGQAANGLLQVHNQNAIMWHTGGENNSSLSIVLILLGGAFSSFRSACWLKKASELLCGGIHCQQARETRQKFIRSSRKRTWAKRSQK